MSISIFLKDFLSISISIFSRIALSILIYQTGLLEHHQRRVCCRGRFHNSSASKPQSFGHSLHWQCQLCLCIICSFFVFIWASSALQRRFRNSSAPKPQSLCLCIICMLFASQHQLLNRTPSLAASIKILPLFIHPSTFTSTNHFCFYHTKHKIQNTWLSSFEWPNNWKPRF